MRLDSFIKKHTPTFHFPNNAYVKEPGFKTLYVRVTRRYILGKVAHPVLDIAYVEAIKPGNGTFTGLVKKLQGKYPDLNIFVESVLNKRFRSKLLSLGFKNADDEGSSGEIHSPSYWLPPHKESQP